MKALIEEDDGPRKYDAASISVINRELYSGFLASCDFANSNFANHDRSPNSNCRMADATQG